MHHASIGVYILPQKRNVLYAIFGQLRRFCQNIVERPRHFRATRKGNDAVCAIFAATFHDRKKSCNTFNARLGQMIEFFDFWKGNINL